jgi:hypothetical protein
MAVTLTGTDGLFTRLGKLFKIVDRVYTHQQDGTAGLAKEIQDAIDEYDGGDNDHILALTGNKLDWQKEAAGIYSTIRQVCEKTIIEMVHDDDPLPSKNLHSAIKRLIDQMETASASIEDSVFVDSLSATTGTGNPVLLTNFRNDEGNKIQNCRTDKLVFSCIKDAQVTGSEQREVFSITGQAPITDIRDPDWPGGYGSVGSIAVSDPGYSQSMSLGRNMLANSDWETFSTTNTPDNWTLAAGVATTNFLTESTTKETGDNSLKLLSSGANVEISQTLNTSGQSTARLRPQTRYCLVYKLYVPTATNSGVLRVRVENGAGAALTDAESTVTLSGESKDSWLTKAVFFSTPLDVHATNKVVIETTTLMTSTQFIFIDNVQLIQPVKYAGKQGFHAILLPGSTAPVLEDEFTLTVSQTTAGTMQKHLDRMLSMHKRGLQFPYSTSATIADSLIA